MQVTKTIQGGVVNLTEIKRQPLPKVRAPTAKVIAFSTPQR